MIVLVAQQPVVELRWKAPVYAVSDSGVYEAYYDGKTACQDKEMSAHQGEDCLYLNIWKADAKSSHTGASEADDAKKPVMVWIHGGAYVVGGKDVDKK